MGVAERDYSQSSGPTDQKVKSEEYGDMAHSINDDQHRIPKFSSTTFTYAL